MGVSYKRICSKEILIFLCIITAYFWSVNTFPVGTRTCKDGQTHRTDSNGLPICCYTVWCNKSQTYKLCQTDQGYDMCRDCRPGTYQNDRFNTVNFDKEEDICKKNPECKAEELILVRNGCQCNLGNGHYGLDPKNCQFDKGNCKAAGHQIDIHGICIECPEDKFKPESGQYGLCRNKTRCKEDEIEVDSGSKKKDRQCKKIQVQTTLFPTPANEPMKKENTTSPVIPEEDKSLMLGILTVIPLLTLVITLVFGMLFIYRKSKYIKTSFRNIKQRICLIKVPSAGGPSGDTIEEYDLMEGVRDGIPIGNISDTEYIDINTSNNKINHPIEEEDGKNVPKNEDDIQSPKKNEKQNIAGDMNTDPKEVLYSDEHETIVKGPFPPEEQRPPPEIPFTQEPESPVSGMIADACNETKKNGPDSLSSSINGGENSSSLGQNNDSNIFQTPTGSVRQPVSQPPIISLHEDPDTTPKSAESDSEFTTAHTEPYGNLPDSDLFSNLPTTQPDEPVITHATGNATTGTDRDGGNKKKPMAIVKPMPNYQSDVPTNVPVSPTTAGGNDIQSPTPELQVSHKIVANAPYGEYAPITVGMNPVSGDVAENQEGLPIDGNIPIESQANNSQTAQGGEAVQFIPSDTSAEDNQECIDDYVDVAGNRSDRDDIVEVESHAGGIHGDGGEVVDTEPQVGGIHGDRGEVVDTESHPGRIRADRGEIVDTESQADGQGTNLHTTASGNPVVAPVSDNSQDEASSSEPLFQDNIENEVTEDEQGRERQRLSEC